MWMYNAVQGLTPTQRLSVVVCFVIFLLNDLYGFVCWSAMKKRQQAACSA